MVGFDKLPDNLPKPIDDGATSHLPGQRLPAICLPSTDGLEVELAGLKGKVVIYCYPKTSKPDEVMPEGWDQIPGARGCTPQNYSYRDHYKELQQLGAQVFGLSMQATDEQKEMVDRVKMPFPILSDKEMKLTKALKLPTFVAADMLLLKRFTMIIKNAEIKAVHYPVFPSDSDPKWVIGYLSKSNL